MWYHPFMRDEDDIAIEVDGAANIAALADEVHRTGRPRLLCRDGQPLARLVPSKRTVRIPTPEQIELSKSAAGSWADVDTDALLAWIYERRALPPKPPIEL